MSDKTDTSGANSHVREMSVTERLRALLDERGVEWRPIAWNPKKETFYHTPDGVGFCADEYVDGVKIYTDALITPEQAIDATLGRGTCRDVCAGISEFTCSSCGFNCDLTSWISMFDGDEGRHRHHHHGAPNYCPNCGKQVVE